MLQRGIETPDMDVRWVSSLSWYFLNFFGLNGLYRLILGDENCRLFDSSIDFLLNSHNGVFLAADSSRDMTASPFAVGASAPAGPQDYNKLFKAEIDNLEFAQGLYNWVGNGVEDRVLKRYDKL
jgi:hypothetical protein